MNLAENGKAQVAKRIFDILFSVIGLVCFSWLICLAALLATMDTGKNGIFRQERIGRDGRTFLIKKIRTMHVQQDSNTNVWAY